MRAVDVARSVARPSRLKKPRGILPAAYIFSTSTVSGEEVRVRPRVRATHGGREDHGLARADGDGAVGLLGELARLEDDLTTARLTETEATCPVVIVLM